MMNKLMLGLAAGAFLAAYPVMAGEVLNSEVTPNEDTMVYGEAATPNGGEDAAIVAQPENAPNPLGNPIVDANAAPNAAPAAMPQQSAPDAAGTPVDAVKELPAGVVNQISEQNPSISQEPNPADMNNKIQDTLYESGNRIYDIQSYPASDINQLESPAQPTIDNYPAY